MNEFKCFFGHPLRFLITRLSLGFFYYPCSGSVVGEQNIVNQKENGFVIAVNHQSFMDWLVLCKRSF